jgi:hypothetical protein
VSLADDTALLFAERSQTRPVLYGARSTRAFFDQAGSVRSMGRGVGVQVEKDTLYIQKDTLGAIVSDTTIIVGEVGAESAAGGMEYSVNYVGPIDDGMIIAIALSGGDE